MVEQESDVKRIVKSLLLEIEQREKLEKETKEQFKKHEKMLNYLGDKLSTLESTNTIENYISVSEFCSKKSIDPTHEQLIFGWCIKICSEESEPSKKILKEGNVLLLFPTYVISKAAQHALESNIISQDPIETLEA